MAQVRVDEIGLEHCFLSWPRVKNSVGLFRVSFPMHFDKSTFRSNLASSYEGCVPEIKV